MKKSNFKSLLLLVIGLSFAAGMTSCNRGYGCPNNFSLEQIDTQVNLPMNANLKE